MSSSVDRPSGWRDAATGEVVSIDHILDAMSDLEPVGTSEVAVALVDGADLTLGGEHRVRIS